MSSLSFPDRPPRLNREPPPIIASGATAAAASKPWSLGRVKLFGDDGFNFRDVLSLINPLQHIPIIGNIYRNLTGDVAAPAIRIAGGALFGGPLGAAFAAANVVMKQLFKPAVDAGVLAEPGTALAAQAAPTESRGGWMVANSRAFPVPANAAVNDGDKALAASEVAQLKRACGLEEIEAQRRHLFGSFHVTA